MIPRPPTYSTARLDCLICPVMVDYLELQSCLPPFLGLSLPELPHVPAGRYPVIVEIWRVHDGLIEVAGLTAHQMWELTGGAAGLGLGGTAGALLGAATGGAAGAVNGTLLGSRLGLLGCWLGAAAGATAGAAAGAAVSGLGGALRGARWAAAAGRRSSETASRMVGTYNEIIVTTPCRCYRQRDLAVDFAVVLAAYTDSSASLLGEWFFGWGYRKSRAVGKCTKDGALEVTTGGSAPSLRIVAPPIASATTVSAADSTATLVMRALSHPLLGVLPGKRFTVSFLDRCFNDPGVEIKPIGVGIQATDTFVPGLSGFVSQMPAVATDAPWGTFMVSGLPVTLSYPRAYANVHVGYTPW